MCAFGTVSLEVSISIFPNVVQSKAAKRDAMSMLVKR